MHASISRRMTLQREKSKRKGKELEKRMKKIRKEGRVSKLIEEQNKL